MALRALPVGGDQDKALEALRAVRVYPLPAPGADPQPLEMVETTQRDIDSTCLRWEDNLQFSQTFHGILEAEPVLEEFRPMYGLLSSLGIGRGTPFAPADRTTAILEHAARTGRDQLLVSAFAGIRDDIRAWPDRRWEWASLIADNADFDYRLSIPLPVPGSLFWSITIYDAETRSQVQAEQGMAAQRSLFELRDLPASGTAELRFGPTAPADGAGAWLQTIPGRGWFAYIRIYGPQAPAFDGSWKPGDFQTVD